MATPTSTIGKVVKVHEQIQGKVVHLQKWQDIAWLDLDNPSQTWIVGRTAWEQDFEAMIKGEIQPAEQVHAEFEQEP